MLRHSSLTTLASLSLGSLALLACGSPNGTADDPERLGAVGEALAQGPVTLVAKHSGKCFENVGGLGVQNTCTGSSAQLWSFTSVTGGFKIVSVSDPTVCLNIPNGSTTRGTQVAISACSSAGATGQVWNPQAAGSDVHLVNVAKPALRGRHRRLHGRQHQDRRVDLLGRPQPDLDAHPRFVVRRRIAAGQRLGLAARPVELPSSASRPSPSPPPR